MDQGKTFDHGELPHRGDELHLFREVYQTYQALVTGFGRATGMPGSRFQVMHFLAGSSADVGVTDIARGLGIDSAAVSRLVQDLERERLVRRGSDARDSRRSPIVLTAEGRRAFLRAHEGMHDLERLLSATFDPQELRRATTTLAKLRAFIERRP